jgi:LDH2 family malate/lactate/ureidoglycolate dehydrogenase
MPTFSPEALRRVAQFILEAAGTPPDLAQIVGESLVESNLVGHDSHGVMRLMQYLALVRQGQVQPAARPTRLSTHQATARVDAARGWGQPAARLATQTAIGLAQDYGVGVVTIDRCNHIGRLGEYVESISQAGMIGMAMCNAEAVVAPFGGRQGRMGTNPMAWAMPRGPGQEPLLVDFATSGVAEGKLQVARVKGERVAPGLILDRDGHGSIEPADFYAGGALLPFGGHKGYGISVMIELVAGALSGMGPSMAAQYQGGNGTLLMAINIARFVPFEQFTAQATELCEKIKATPTAEGFSEVLVPGEPEMRSRRQRLAAGIVLPEQTWQSIQALAAELKVTL